MVVKECKIQQCNKCKKFKSVWDFYAARGRRSGRAAECKECKNAAVRLSEYRAGRRRTPEQIKRDNAPFDPNRTHKHCKCCEKLKPLTDFYKESRTRDGYQTKCKECQKSLAQISYAENKPKVLARQKSNYCPKRERNKKLLKDYGIDIAQYDAMLKSQKGKCGICGSSDPNHNSGQFVVDHCHTTGNVRGLLCGECNFMLGKSKDSIKVLQSAINYLKAHELVEEAIRNAQRSA